MKKIAIAAMVGMLAAALLGGVWFGAPYAGVHLDPTKAAAAAAILVLGTAVAMFTLVAMNRPVNALPYQRQRLSDEPAQHAISRFRTEEKLQFLARPDMSVGQILVKHGDAAKNPPGSLDKKIVLTIKDAKKGEFNPRVLRQLFAALAPQLEHVLLMSDGDAFVGYIPGERALKDFTGANAESKITEAVINVLKDPQSEASAKAIRGVGGITSGETVDENDFVRQAAAKVYANDKTQGFLIHRNLKPVGIITKVDLLALASSEAFIAGV